MTDKELSKVLTKALAKAIKSPKRIAKCAKCGAWHSTGIKGMNHVCAK